MLNIQNKKLILVAVIIGAIVCFCVWQNNSIVVSKSKYINPKIPETFNDLTIVHISDLHSKKFGENQKKILGKIKSVSPHIIVITGDLIDRRNFDLETALIFIKGAVDLAPVYFITGNHEAWSGKYPLIKEKLAAVGVHIIDDMAIELTKGQNSIKLLGVSDPAFLTSDYMENSNTDSLKKQLKQWSDDSSFKILLSHRPELFETYCENNMDLIFSGHAHGGQFRIPFIGGLAAPNQGLFPKYTSGSHTKNSSTMFVSRGLGASIIPIRIFNRPEIVVVTLNNK